MARIRRIVVPDVAHHVTQRGVRRTRVVFSESDARFFLRLLRQYCAQQHVQLLAYCIMPNHTHLVVVPPTADALAKMLRPLHMRFAQRINSRRGWSGALWQGRYFSSAMDERHLWAAIRYVERNPVRAGLVNDAANYAWSSARAHCGLRTDSLLTSDRAWRDRLRGIEDWPAWLAEGEDEAILLRLRCNVQKGRPCGSPEFLAGLERATGRSLKERPCGRPKRTARRAAAIV